MSKYDVFTSKFAQDIYLQKYSMNGQETWADTCRRVVTSVCGQLLTQLQQTEILQYMIDRKFIPGGRYLHSAGRPWHQVNNCFLFRAEDSREQWADLCSKAMLALMSQGGIGVDYSKVREEGAPVRKTGTIAGGPISLMHSINEIGRGALAGGGRRSAIWAGLNWKHPDIFKFIDLKNWSTDLRNLKDKDLNFKLSMELTNISVIYDTEFFIAKEDFEHPDHNHAQEVWQRNCRQAFSTAEPGMSFNFCKDNESLRNACCEVVSENDSDKCNLGTVWMNRCKSKQEFAKVVKASTLFLLCGGIYSDVPTDKIKEVGLKNNRIGLGLGGIHEWLMSRDSRYEVTIEMHKWLRTYQQESDSMAYIGAKQLNVSIPKGIRAIAPTGTIGILAETTTGIEPLFCSAYKRRYFDSGIWKFQYVVDGAVKRLLDKGIAMENIQDSYDISMRDRIKFQADVQQYVDMSISSTCNLPQWGSEKNSELNLKEHSDTLFEYAKRLRGFTAYPDGCRTGQPLTRVSLEEALKDEGKIFEEKEIECIGGICGL